jgi:hypothetical protein
MAWVSEPLQSLRMRMVEDPPLNRNSPFLYIVFEETISRNEVINESEFTPNSTIQDVVNYVKSSGLIPSDTPDDKVGLSSRGRPMTLGAQFYNAKTNTPSTVTSNTTLEEISLLFKDTKFKHTIYVIVNTKGGNYRKSRRNRKSRRRQGRRGSRRKLKN